MNKTVVMVLVLLLAGSVSAATAVRVIELDGTWKISGYDESGTRKIDAVDGRVPGQVHPDLQRAGLIADPFWRDQADLCQWVETYEWRYFRTFQLPKDFPRGWVVLQFDGLDTFATVLLNGKEVGKTDNMFIPHEFEVGRRLREGLNTVEVRFAPAVASVKDKPHQQQFAVFDDTGARTYIRRMQCGFRWDWVHRFVSAGIWRPCRLAAYPEARVEDVFAYTKTLTRECAEVEIAVTSVLRTNRIALLRMSVLAPDRKTVWTREMPAEQGVARFTARIPQPQWWWPNGAGDQPLYRVTASLLDGAGAALDVRELETGLRTVALEELPDAEGKGSSFTLVVNGTRLFAKGGNWVPADPFPSRVTDEHYARLLGQARDAGMNMLRAWGGGIYEPEAFWRACDRMGIMVSQDFLLACADYPEHDEAFTRGLKKEFATAVRLLRNHPSLVFWSGDNELGLNSGPDKEWNFKKFHREVTAPLMRELDPSRPFRPTSPYGGYDVNNSVWGGDSHRSSMPTSEMYGGDMRNYRELIDKTTGRFMSEHALAGAPPKRSLLRFMTEEDLSGTAMWEYHTKDNPYVGHPLGLTYWQLLKRESELLYGEPGGDTDRAIRQMEYAHYEFARLGMESARRRKFWCSGIQFWMFNDCWPASGWSVVDYWGGRKAGWYGQAAGCRPVIAAQEVATNAVRWWVCNDRLVPVEAEVEVSVQPWSGKPRWAKSVKITVPANVSKVALELPLQEFSGKMGGDAALVCDLRHAGGVDRSWWFPGLPREMRVPSAGLRVVSETRGEGEGAVTLRTENWARVVTLDADADFSDNYFELLPGEVRTITWRAASRNFEGKIKVSCWNP
jgi:beta-mannosidase